MHAKKLMKWAHKFTAIDHDGCLGPGAVLPSPFPPPPPFPFFIVHFTVYFRFFSCLQKVVKGGKWETHENSLHLDKFFMEGLCGIWQYLRSSSINAVVKSEVPGLGLGGRLIYLDILVK